MRWFRWWRTDRVKAPSQRIEIPNHASDCNQSDQVLKESKKKLNDAIKTKKEVTQVVKASDHFAEALHRAMRRSHG